MEIIKNNAELRQKLHQIFTSENIFRLPNLKSVTVNIGIGQFKEDQEKVEKIINMLTTISGQKPRKNLAKKSVSAFKTRKGQIIGYSVTLRNKIAFDFISKLFNVALPRIRDFRGLASSSINGRTLNIGIKENIIFPEVTYENFGSISGLQISLTMNSKYQDDQAMVKKAFKLLGAKFKTD